MAGTGKVIKTHCTVYKIKFIKANFFCLLLSDGFICAYDIRQGGLQISNLTFLRVKI